jgi:hypothetical protein
VHFTPSRGLSVHLRDESADLAMPVDLVHADLTEDLGYALRNAGLEERRVAIRQVADGLKALYQSPPP